VDYSGTVLLVSHDRTFLNNVVTSTIVFDDDGVREFFGGYDDWLRQRKAPPARREPTPAVRAPARRVSDAAASKRKLSFKEQQELSRLPTTIENCEAEIAELHRVMAQPSFYQQPGAQIAAEQARLKELECQLASCYQRWEELEQLA
jgi:ATP-binding cassette subfamily F protein uup